MDIDVDQGILPPSIDVVRKSDSTPNAPPTSTTVITSISTMLPRNVYDTLSPACLTSGVCRGTARKSFGRVLLYSHRHYLPPLGLVDEENLCRVQAECCACHPTDVECETRKETGEDFDTGVLLKAEYALRIIKSDKDSYYPYV